MVVTGLGLIGLLAVQILKANGCKVLGIDKDSQKCALAKRFGAEVVDLSNGDNVQKLQKLFRMEMGWSTYAASSSSNKIMQQTLKCARRA